ncbi:hypothetical protein [Mesorhizobium sp. CAU 1741]|uniref:hypothetical protein n=1 Tax=Mesorhizobium sp. CAU 1741 TaxID=3140366 RepID=UPI00325A4BE5
MATMTFHSWRRSSLMDNATLAEGRLSGTIAMTLDDPAVDAPPRAFPVPIAFRSAADVSALKPEAIRHTAPRPATADAETTKFVHIDFAEPDLPWRYSPAVPEPEAPGGIRTRLRPWIVLLVGEASELDVRGGVVVPAKAVLDAHPLGESYRWAHVHGQDGSAIARLLSPRRLLPLRRYVAAVVPAFDAAGHPAWQDGELVGEHLAVLHSWRFQTGEQGDFETLAAALRVRRAGSLGVANVRYARPVADVDVTLKLGGAITSLADLPDQTAELDIARADLRQINSELEDAAEPHEAPPPPMRDIMQLPRYGGLWVHDTEAVQWTRSINDDPRHRGVSGLGLEMGIVGQEPLMAAAVEQAGALNDAAQRIAFLALGLGMSSSLWRRRLPEAPERRLCIFGPAMSRMMADTGGTVLDEVTSQRSVLERSLFSSAGMRLTRKTTARSRAAGKSRVDRVALLQAANQLPVSPDGPAEGVPHADLASLKLGTPTLADRAALPKLGEDAWGLIEKFHGQPNTDEVRDYFIQLVEEVLGLGCRDFIQMYFDSLSPWPAILERDLLIGALNACRGGKEWFWLVGMLPHPSPPDPRRAVNIDGLCAAVASAIDPTAVQPIARARVESTIEGLELGSLAPPEAPIGLDYPAWTLLRNNEREWLLPGVSDMETDSIVALRTNPTFIDAFMVGLNTQFLAEMRWRGLPAPRVSTPLRMFWGYVDYTTGKRDADIQPIGSWPSQPAGAPEADDIGDLSHQAFKSGDETGKTDLVIAFSTSLFRRYPSTLVYLVRPPAGLAEADLDTLLADQPNFEEAPLDRDARRYFGPIFQGEIMPHLVFFAFDVDPSNLEQYWLVLDEPPAELRFRNDRGSAGSNAALFAKETIDRPTRVVISGSALEAMAGETP